MSAYKDKLQDPLWQRKKSDIQNIRGWTCEECKATNKTLHVHHGAYLPLVDPWDYPEEMLHLLCFECHNHRKPLDNEVKRAIGTLDATNLKRVTAIGHLLNDLRRGRLSKEIVKSVEPAANALLSEWNRLKGAKT